jgi:hypothetical protein
MVASGALTVAAVGLQQGQPPEVPKVIEAHRVADNTSVDDAAAYTFPAKYKDYNFRYATKQYMQSVYNDMKK